MKLTCLVMIVSGCGRQSRQVSQRAPQPLLPSPSESEEKTVTLTVRSSHTYLKNSASHTDSLENAEKCKITVGTKVKLKGFVSGPKSGHRRYKKLVSINPQPSQSCDLSPVFVFYPDFEVPRQQLDRPFTTTANRNEPSTPSKPGWPLKGEVTVTSKFGLRFSPTRHRCLPHEGIDLSAATGTKIYAPVAGQVGLAEVRGGYGKLMVLDHGDQSGYPQFVGMKLETFYAHLSAYQSAVGKWVEKDRWIATSGATGKVSGPHLHYEIRLDDVPWNPEKPFNADQPIVSDACR